MQSKEIVRWVKRIEQFMSEAWSAEGGGRVVFDWLFLILGGLRAAAAALLRTKEKANKSIKLSSSFTSLFSIWLNKEKIKLREKKKRGQSEPNNKQKEERSRAETLSFGWLWPLALLQRKRLIPFFHSFKNSINSPSPHGSCCANQPLHSTSLNFVIDLAAA